MQHRIPLTRRQLAGSLTWGLISLLGWALFVYWWGAVFNPEQPRPLFRLVFFLMLLMAATLLTTFSWIWHNMRIARRGHRGMASRYRPQFYEQDALGRKVVVLDAHLVRTAAVIVVTADDNTKTFTPDAHPTS